MFAGLREPPPQMWMSTDLSKAIFGLKVWYCRTMFWAVMRVMVATVSYFDAPLETLVNQSLSFSIAEHFSACHLFQRHLWQRVVDTAVVVLKFVNHHLTDIALTCPFGVLAIFQLTIHKNT